MSERPSFSLVVACYNTESYLAECLSSLVNQIGIPKDAYEVIVVDDGSTDKSSSIMTQYSDGLNFHIVRQMNLGLEKACNRGIREAKNDWVVRVDADDFLPPDFLEKMSEGILRQPGFDFYFPKQYVEYYSVTEKTVREVPEFDPEEIWERGDFFATGTAYRRNLFQVAGYYEEDVKNCGLENYNFILRLLLLSKRGCSVKEASFFYRRHHTNMSLIKRAQIIEYGRKLLSRYNKPFKTNQNHPYQLILD